MSGMWGIKKPLWGAVAFAMATAFALCGAQAASASPQTLASVTVRAPIGAYGGWVVWSAPVSGGWGLDAYHEDESQSPTPGDRDAAVRCGPRHERIR